MEIETTIGEIDQIKKLGKAPGTRVKVLIEEAPEAKVSESKKSRWTQLIEEVASNPELDLDGYSEQLRTDMKEFRQNFEFKHDR